MNYCYYYYYKLLLNYKLFFACFSGFADEECDEGLFGNDCCSKNCRFVVADAQCSSGELHVGENMFDENQD